MSDPEQGRETIDRDAIQSKFEELKDGFDHTAAAARTPMLAAGIASLAVLVVLAFVLGRRRGRSSRTVVEVRRV